MTYNEIAAMLADRLAERKVDLEVVDEILEECFDEWYEARRQEIGQETLFLEQLLKKMGR